MISVSKRLDISHLYTWFVRGSRFPQAQDADYEQRKLNVLRIVVGLIALWRTLKILYTAPFYFATESTMLGVSFQPHTVYACAESLLLVAFTCGLVTPIATLLLILTYSHFDATMGTSTLGTNVFTLLLILMIAANAGTRYSLDSWILNRKRGWPGRALRRVYGILGMPSTRQLTLLFLFLFVAFALISLGSALHHLRDPDWMAGRTVGVLLTNSYLSRFYPLFRQIESAFPAGFMLFSAAAIVAQSIFQFLMLPLMFSRWGKRFVVLQGLMFFTVSATLLQLSYLPFLEFALWAAVFLDKASFQAIKRWTRKMRGLGAACIATSAETHVAGSITRDAYSPPACPRPGWVKHLIPWTVTTAFILFVLCFPKGPKLNWYVSGKLGLPQSQVSNALYYVGLDVPCVFNKADLGMGDTWPVVYRLHPSGARTLIPFNGTDGQRLRYHLADTLYFGNSLIWRRWMIGKAAVATARAGSQVHGFVESVLCFDYRLNELSGPVMYEIEIYTNHSSDASIGDASKRYRPRLALTFTETIELSSPRHVVPQRVRTAHAKAEGVEYAASNSY